MNKVFIILVVIFAGLAALLIFQVSRSEVSVVMEPKDLLAYSGSQPLTRIRVGGKVSGDPIDYQVEPKIELKFRLQDRNDSTHSVPVIYAGLKPDMFATGRDVLVDGEYSQGVLVAKKLLTQCPSKYEAPSPTANLSQSSAAETKLGH